MVAGSNHFVPFANFSPGYTCGCKALDIKCTKGTRLAGRSQARQVDTLDPTGDGVALWGCARMCVL
eukprot:8172623-Pyramimonas_sp.AAC.1